MKLQAIKPYTNSNNNLNFGYNKKLSAELAKRVTSSDNEQVSLVADNILLADEFCRFTEEKIIELEGLNLSDVAQNSDAIDMLAELLITVKGSIANIVENLFPDMKYAHREAASYNNDIENFDYPMDEVEMAESGDPYFWRQELIDQLEKAHDLAQESRNEKLNQQLENGEATISIILPPNSDK